MAKNTHDHHALAAWSAAALALAAALWAVPPAAAEGAASAAVGQAAPAVETERLYLSGTGHGDTRDWQFRIEQGRRAGAGWATIPVPAQWELAGFGTYRYGRHDGAGGETGHYRHRFEVPREWRGRRIRLVFGGVMTDTEARLNGRPAGPAHRGGFTRFAYDVTDLVLFDRDNLLEVRVDETSANGSVERAEREADYWVFGGIYRPVWLEATPASAITHVAIDARHDGRLTVAVETALADPSLPDTRVTARVHDLEGRPLGAALGAAPDPASGDVSLSTRIPGARPWSAERPNLYELRLELRRGGETLHLTRRRFGFRTFEVRYGEGLFVNGRRVLLRGINRHSFWPDSGRALNREINRRDAELLVELNVNAVRASHYPPDEAFLDACDELGLYVIDELPGWHDAYDTAVGERLVAEMVRRDVNHPSIVFWANGNEGGWNPALDDDFHRHDPQRRPVLHPDDVRSGIATFHYPRLRDLRDELSDDTLANRVRSWIGRERLVMPTEILHGLYDGGLGAGLEGVWHLLENSPRAAGAFLWAFVDEGVVRTDRDGELDTFGNYAPDGLVGPYREKEASFRAVKSLWSPVQAGPELVASPSGYALPLRNRFSEIDLGECSFDWRALALPAPGGETRVVASGTSAGPRVPPGEGGELRLAPPDEAFDAVEVTARSPSGREIETWVFPVAPRSDLVDRWVPDAGRPAAVAMDAPTTPALGALALRAGDRRVELIDGRLDGLVAGAARVPLAGGPRRVGHEAPPPPRGLGFEGDGRRGLRAVYEDELAQAVWTLFDSGWLRLEIEYPRKQGWLEGIAFTLPEDWIHSIEWLGRGPDPVWVNRLAGPRLGHWRRDLAATAPGRQARGFYDGVRWVRLEGADGALTVVPEDDGLFVGISAPRFPEDARNAVAKVPATDTLTFLHSISAIGTKFHPAEAFHWHGLNRGRRPETLRISLWLFWEPVERAAATG